MNAEYIDISEENASARVESAIRAALYGLGRDISRALVLCIGSDRATGDALGPLVGSRLGAGSLPKDITVLGTLESTVHAANFAEAYERIKKRHPNTIVIAVDASLGHSGMVGSVKVSPGAMTPGAGALNSLPPAGDMYITGIVGKSGGSDRISQALTLQTTKLAFVMDMADVISDGLLRAFGKKLTKTEY